MTSGAIYLRSDRYGKTPIKAAEFPHSRRSV